MPDVTTNVKQVDVDLDNIDSWLGAPGSDNILTPTSEDKTKPAEAAKPNFFSNKPVDLGFIDNEDEDQPEPVKDPENQNPPADAPPVKVDDILNELETAENDEDPEKKKPGRPKTEKNGLIEFFKKRIESKEMFAFDDYDEEKQSLDEYLGSLSEKDLDELYTANITQIKEDIASQTPKEFFESLPQELQYAAKYVADGGQDLKGLFQALAHVEQTRELDPSNDGDQESIVRNYLQATKFGTPEEIDEEIVTWKDLGVLGKKAGQFKPKLDKMQEEIVAQKLAEQEKQKQQQQQAVKEYMDNVFEALRPGEINGLKLDKNTQAKLYSGLTQAQYPSMSGRPTNLLGHLLEKHQFVEPNYQLIAEALWLLSDPDDYRKSLAKTGQNQAAADISRKLKTEQQRKQPSTNTLEDQEENKTRRIPRQNNSFFKR
jgi:hypothetical protein